MAGLHISDNIRLVLDLVDYIELIPNHLIILFLHFQEALHTVRHTLINDLLTKTVFHQILFKEKKCAVNFYKAHLEDLASTSYT